MSASSLSQANWMDGHAVSQNAGRLWVRQMWTEVVGLDGEGSSLVLCVLNSRCIQCFCKCGRQSNGPNDAYVQRRFVDVIKSRMLRWEPILGYAGGPSAITRVHIGGGRHAKVREGAMMTRAGVE